MLTALSLLTMQSFAQTPMESLRRRFSEGAVSMTAEYEMTVRQIPVAGSSELFVQGDRYCMKGNGLEVFCNGESIWTIDESAMEVVVEPCDAMSDSYASNPVLLLAQLDEFFAVKSQNTAGGRTEYTLTAIKDCGISQAQVALTPDGHIVTGSFLLEDGTIVSVKVTSMKKAEERSSSSFSPSRKFGTDWIVTDLR